MNPGAPPAPPATGGFQDRLNLIRLIFSISQCRTSLSKNPFCYADHIDNSLEIIEVRDNGKRSEHGPGGIANFLKNIFRHEICAIMLPGDNFATKRGFGVKLY